MGQVLECEIANVVDPNFTVVAKIRKIVADRSLAAWAHCIHRSMRNLRRRGGSPALISSVSTRRISLVDICQLKWDHANAVPKASKQGSRTGGSLRGELWLAVHRNWWVSTCLGTLVLS